MFPDNNNPNPQFQPAQQQPVQQQPQQPQYQAPAPQQPDYTQQPQQPAPQQQPQFDPNQQQPQGQPQQQPAQNDPNYTPGLDYGFLPENSDFVQSQQNQQQVQQPNGDQQFGQQDPNQQQPQFDPNQQQQPQFDPNNPQGQQQQPQTPFAPTAQPNQPVVQNIQQMEQSFDQWLDQEYPMPELPNINDIAADDPVALQNFFVEYDKASRGRVAVEAERRELKSAKEEILWQEVHRKYGNLRHAPNVLQTVKQMYEGARAMGNFVTPLQVVDQYVGTLNQNYQRGYQANNTQVQIRQSQPLPNGGSRQAPPTPVVSQQDMQNLNQNGNDVIEDAAAVIRKMRAAGHGGL